MIARRQYGPGKGEPDPHVPRVLKRSKAKTQQFRRIQQKLARPTQHKPGSFAKVILMTRRIQFLIDPCQPGDYTSQVTIAGTERDPRQQSAEPACAASWHFETLEEDWDYESAFEERAR